MRTLFRAGWGGVKLTFWLLVLVVSLIACIYQLGARNPIFIFWIIKAIAATIMMVVVIRRTVSLP